MSRSAFVVLLCSLMVLICAGSLVKNITAENFEQIIKANKYVMVKFYAPWCGHCQKMVPEYQKLAQLTQDNDVIIGKVNAEEEKTLAEKFKVEGFPTIKLFVEGNAIEYKDTRTAETMVQWMKEVMETQIKEISREELEKIKEQKNVLTYEGSDERSKLLLKLLSIDSSDQTVQFYWIGSQQSSKFILYPRTKQSLTHESSQTTTIQTIKSWLTQSLLPTVVPLSTKANLEWVFYNPENQKDVAMLLKEKDLSEETFTKFEQVCELLKDKIKCCMVDDSMQIYKGVKSYVRGKGDSVLVLTRDTLKEEYLYKQTIGQLTAEKWVQFMAEVAQGKHPNLASIEEDRLEYSHVKVLAKENYTQFLGQNQFVLMEFVSRGCANCVDFAQEYDLLAKKAYEQNAKQDTKQKLQVAAVDVKKYGQLAAEVNIMDLPSFGLYVNGALIKYQGPRKSDKIMEFVEEILKRKIIVVSSIAEVPTPSVVVYDPAQVTSLKNLPCAFSRYQVYHLRQGQKVEIVLRLQDQQKTYPNSDLTLSLISKWLTYETDPVLVNMLNTSIQGKLRHALQNKIHLLGLIDVEQQLSASLRKTLEDYCKGNAKIVCGYALKGEDHFDDLMAWAGVDKDLVASRLIYVDTEKFEKYLFQGKVDEVNSQSIEQFINDVKEGKVKKTKEEEEIPKDKKFDADPQAQVKPNESNENEQNNEQL